MLWENECDRPGRGRVFLFLQSHPSFFGKAVIEHLRARGAPCHVVNLSLGDWIFRRGTGALNYRGSLVDWPAFLEKLVEREGVSDIVFYADQRPYHRAARALARRTGRRAWAYEFGYLRPDWITLERSGLGAFSHFPDDPDLVEGLAAGLHFAMPQAHYPYTFNDEALNEVLFHLTPVFFPFAFPRYIRDRYYHPLVDYLSYIPKLVTRRARQRRARRVVDDLAGSRDGYFVVVMQMQGDYQVRRASSYRRLHEMIEEVLASFAAMAHQDERLLFKMHPLESGFENWPRVIRAEAAARGLGERVVVIDGGDLRRLLRHGRGVVLLNSTAGLTALMEGVPVKTLGIAVYDMPRLTHQGPLDTFWTRPEPPTRRTVEAFVKLLAASVQVKGNFFTPEGRAAAVPEFARRLLEEDENACGAFVDPPPRLEKARRMGVPGANFDEIEVGEPSPPSRSAMPAREPAA